jgi:hypothetical protein
MCLYDGLLVSAATVLRLLREEGYPDLIGNPTDLRGGPGGPSAERFASILAPVPVAVPVTSTCSIASSGHNAAVTVGACRVVPGPSSRHGGVVAAGAQAVLGGGQGELFSNAGHSKQRHRTYGFQPLPLALHHPRRVTRWGGLQRLRIDETPTSAR